MENNPLVSIVVVTYNSSQYVLETLESAKTQTYQNIELIVSDDCSTDNTVEICRDWLDKNRARFVRTELVISPCNTGIPANANRGNRVAQGEWIKAIAGDDILLPNCIDSLLRATSEGCDVLAGISQSFWVNSENQKIWGRQYPSLYEHRFFEKSVEKQHQILLVDSFNFAPGTFISKKLFLALGGYDERFRFLEDLPFWLKCTSNGHKISLLKEPVVLYRTGHDSMVFQRNHFYNIAFSNCLFRFRKEVIYKEVPWYNLLFWERELVERSTFHFITKVCHNRKNRLTVTIGKISARFCIHAYYSKIKKLIFEWKASGQKQAIA